jgi:hypothetical protein
MSLVSLSPHSFAWPTLFLVFVEHDELSWWGFVEWADVHTLFRENRSDVTKEFYKLIHIYIKNQRDATWQYVYY